MDMFEAKNICSVLLIFHWKNSFTESS